MAVAERTRVGTGFADLVYTDEEWLRREFDALVAANFGPPMRPGPPAPPRASPAGRPFRYLLRAPGARGPRGSAATAGLGSVPARQRAPPRAGRPR